MNNYRRARKSNKLVKSAKDYIIPAILGLFVILILFNIFSGDSNEEKTKNTKTNVEQTQSSINISFKTPDTQAVIVEGKNKETPLKDKSSIELDKKIFVKKGILEIEKKGDFKASLNKGGKLIISKNNDKDSDFDKIFKISASDFFITPSKKEKIKMNLLEVSLNDNSIVSVRQNDAYSSVYVLSGTAVVKTNAGAEITLTKNEKISISLGEANDKDLDLNTKKEQINSVFLEENWCKINNCENILNKDENSSNKENSQDKKIPKKISDLDKKSKDLIKISGIEDQEQVFEDKINIKGKILKNNISKITFNNKEAQIDEDLSTFNLKGLELNGEINDIVWKVFNDEGDLIGRGVYTIYYNGKLGNNGFANNNNKPKVENYPIDFEKKFQIIFPKTNPFYTTATVVKIEGAVPAGMVDKIKVNNFTLTKFKPGGTYWNFFANAKYGYLKDGINDYEIKYYGKDGKLLYKHTFRINKK